MFPPQLRTGGAVLRGMLGKLENVASLFCKSVQHRFATPLRRVKTIPVGQERPRESLDLINTVEVAGTHFAPPQLRSRLLFYSTVISLQDVLRVEVTARLSEHSKQGTSLVHQGVRHPM
jgi:hypothetical protein